MISLTARLAFALAGLGAVFILFLQPSQDHLTDSLIQSQRVERTLSLYALKLPGDVPVVPDRDATLKALCGTVGAQLARMTHNFGCLKTAQIDTTATAEQRKLLTTQLEWMDRYQDRIASPIPRIDVSPLYRWRHPNPPSNWIGSGTVVLDAAYQSRIRRIREHTRRLLDADGDTPADRVRLALACAGMRQGERYHDGAFVVVPMSDSLTAAFFLRGQAEIVTKPGRLLDLLTCYPLGWLAGGTALLCLALLLGAGWFAAIGVILFQMLLAVGYIAVGDVSLLGLSSDKVFLLLRQFETGTTIRIGEISIWWWHGYTAAMLVLIGMRAWSLPAIQDGVENLLASLLYGIDRRKASAIVLMWVLLATASMLAPGSGALVAEIEILLAASALGFYIAVHGDAMRAESYAHALDNVLLWVGVFGCGAIILALQARGDSGHVLLTASLALWFLALSPASWGLRVAIALAVVAIVVAASYIDPGQVPVSRIDERIATWHDPLGRGPSDLARLQFLQQLAGPQGFGVGLTPWRGITPISGGGVPQQVQSDYGLALLSAIFGTASAAWLIAAAVALYLVGMLAAMRAASLASSRAVAWCLATFSCLSYAIAIRSLISVAGTAVVTPMTGVNVALMTYGPTATLDEAIVLAVCVGSTFFARERTYAVRRNPV